MSRYRFNIEKNDDMYIIRVSETPKEEWLPKYFFQPDNGIYRVENVNAIVEKNGTGKTMLLYEMSGMSFSSKVNPTNYDILDRLVRPINENSQSLVIIHEDGTLKCYHNLSKPVYDDTGLISIVDYYNNPFLRKQDEVSHWRLYIESYGYNTEAPKYEFTSKSSARSYAVKTLLCKYSLGIWYPELTTKIKKWLSSAVGFDDIIAVRGKGIIGKRMSGVFDKAGIKYYFLGKNEDVLKNGNQLEDFYNNVTPIFIASTIYEQEIVNELEDVGYKHFDNYATYIDFELFICKEYPYVTDKLKRKYLHLD